MTVAQVAVTVYTLAIILAITELRGHIVTGRMSFWRTGPAVAVILAAGINLSGLLPRLNFVCAVMVSLGFIAFALDGLIESIRSRPGRPQ